MQYDYNNLRLKFDNHIAEHNGCDNALSGCINCRRNVNNVDFQLHCPEVKHELKNINERFIFGRWVTSSFVQKEHDFNNDKRAIWVGGVENDYSFGFCEFDSVVSNSFTGPQFKVINPDEFTKKNYSYFQGVCVFDNYNLYPLYFFNDILKEGKECDHEYVNVSFNQIKMVCKYCDKELRL